MKRQASKNAQPLQETAQDAGRALERSVSIRSKEVGISI